jgi:transketolase
MHLAPAKLQSLQIMANRLRRHSLIATSKAKSGHPTSSMSCADIVSTLFFEFLRFDVKNPKNPRNDRFILSKGHAAPVLWAVWAEADAFPVEKLQTLRDINSDLEGHPTPRNPYVDVATGSLGQGLSAGVGMALTARADDLDNRIYVLMGDGEAAEGSVWEAAELASHYHLDNLTVIIDRNGLQITGPTEKVNPLEPLADKFRAFGYAVCEVDGNDTQALTDLFNQLPFQPGKPNLVLAHTVKGKGISFIENSHKWHHRVPSDEEYDNALRELTLEYELDEGR